MSDLEKAIGRLLGAPVLVVGDVMLDRFVYGEVERISPEAPIPVLKVAREASMLGGAGNVVRNLKALGAVPRLVAPVGADAAGALVQKLMDESGAGATLVRVEGRPTTVKTRFVAQSHQLLRADSEDARPLADKDVDALIAAAEVALSGVRALVLSDYAKGALPPRLLARLIAAAARREVAVVVDPRGHDYAIYRGADLVTPNRSELRLATRMSAEGDAGVAAAAEALIASTGVRAVLATRGADGMTLARPGRPALHLKARAREVFDVSGAGDTVVATVAAALAGGVALEHAVALANIAAGIVVGKVGTAVARADEIAAALAEGDSVASKVLSRDQAVELVSRWRSKSLTVGFTNGCFDLLHPGHISLLEQARAACDRLIVGLNADSSVRRLKGDGRPVQDERARATVLAALAAVDAVVLFSEDTPLALIQALKPDLLVKGKDYRLDQVVGADDVRSWGGRVMLADIMPGHSTTGTIARIGG